jgi:hypothetical protein
MLMKKQLTLGLVGLALLVIIFGTIYVTVQQSQRSDANYPQIQLAEDTAQALDQGNKPAPNGGFSIDIAQSLAPFTIIYDKSGKPISGNGYLNNKLPKAPLGILKGAASKEYNAVSWQPRSDVRIASVSVAAKDYYVLSGRSLKEVERNENLTFQLAMLGGSVSVLVLGGALALSGTTKSTKKPAKKPSKK